MDFTPDVERTDPPTRRRRTPPKKLAPRPRLSEHEVEASLEEIAAAFGVSRQRAKQLVDGALLKAETILRRLGLTLRHFLDAVDQRRDGEAL